MHLELAARELLLKNRKHKGNFQYTLPSFTSYPYQWLWDSCFHAIILSHFSIDDAKKEILSLISAQFDNGMLPHMIYWKPQDIKDYELIKWGKVGTSSITQPPMLAYAVWEIFQKDKQSFSTNKDVDFLKSVYPQIYHFYKYLLNERDPHEKHLIGIMNPDESGEDNSPRFDIPLDLSPEQTLKENTEKRRELIEQNISCNFDAPFCMRNFFWVKDVPFNSIMVENLRILSQIAEKIGKKGDAIYFIQKADQIAHAMRELMLEDGIFWSTYGEDYKKIKVKTWAMFSPLFAKILTQKEAEILVKTHLLNKSEFWTDYPVPTVSLDDPSFDPKGFWRGPTWIATNWFIYKGLLNYGFTEIAEEIKRSTEKLIQKSGFREQFNPLTGEGQGAQNFTWGALVIDM